jgi:predicted acetyltransferase
MNKDIRLLAEDERPLAKTLWKEAFHDSDAFIDWYFNHKILNGNSLCMFEGGELLSIVHMIPYTVRIQGRPVKSAFIAGVATSQKRRGEGLMRTMLLESLTLLKSRGIAITHLYPFSHKFYEKFGWTSYSSVSRQKVTAASRLRGADVIETMDADELAPLYNRMMKGYDGYVIRGKREWNWRLGELKSDGGRCAVLIKDDKACAYMLYYVTEEKADIIETVYQDEEDIGALLAYLLSQGHGRAEYYIPSEGIGSVKHGMARIVDAKALLGIFDAQELLLKYDIVDDFAVWNHTQNGCKQRMSAAELAHLIHCGKNKRDSALGHFFAPKKTCIFEAY